MNFPPYREDQTGGWSWFSMARHFATDGLAVNDSNNGPGKPLYFPIYFDQPLELDAWFWELPFGGGSANSQLNLSLYTIRDKTVAGSLGSQFIGGPDKLYLNLGTVDISGGAGVYYLLGSTWRIQDPGWYWVRYATDLDAAGISCFNADHFPVLFGSFQEWETQALNVFTHPSFGGHNEGSSMTPPNEFPNTSPNGLEWHWVGTGKLSYHVKKNLGAVIYTP